MTLPGDPAADPTPPSDTTSSSDSASTASVPASPTDSVGASRPGPPPPDRPDVELVPPAPSTSGWPAQAADAIVGLVDQVKAKTTGPAITAARGLVFGVIVGVLGIVVAILLLIFLIRLTTDLLELVWDGAGVWLTYLIYGVLFTAIGAIVFGKRHVRGLD